jgi:hypothetical protein
MALVIRSLYDFVAFFADIRLGFFTPIKSATGGPEETLIQT